MTPGDYVVRFSGNAQWAVQQVCRSIEYKGLEITFLPRTNRDRLPAAVLVQQNVSVQFLAHRLDSSECLCCVVDWFCITIPAALVASFAVESLDKTRVMFPTQRSAGFMSTPASPAMAHQTPWQKHCHGLHGSLPWSQTTKE